MVMAMAWVGAGVGVGVGVGTRVSVSVKVGLTLTQTLTSAHPKHGLARRRMPRRPLSIHSHEYVAQYHRILGSAVSLTVAHLHRVRARI